MTNEAVNLNNAGTKSTILYSVLNAIDLEAGFITTEGAVELTAEITRGGKKLVADYRLAIKTCLELGWIKVLLLEDCIEDRKRWAENYLRSWANFNEYKPGGIDFTEEGWRQYCRLRMVILGPIWQDRYVMSIDRFQSSPSTISLVSGSRVTLSQEIQQFLSFSPDIVRGFNILPQTTLQATGPYDFGAWWVNRFYRLPASLRADIEVYNLEE